MKFEFTTRGGSLSLKLLKSADRVHSVYFHLFGPRCDPCTRAISSGGSGYGGIMRRDWQLEIFYLPKAMDVVRWQPQHAFNQRSER